jgi:hypothetical protein
MPLAFAVPFAPGANIPPAFEVATVLKNEPHPLCHWPRPMKRKWKKKEIARGRELVQEARGM